MALSTLPLTRATYDRGLSWEGYLSTMKEYGETSSRLYEKAAIEQAERKRFGDIARGHGGEIAVSVMTEAWCGDSAVVLPIVARLAESVPSYRLRLFVGADNPELHSAYHEDGFESIPLLSFFDSTWKEIGRWMERPKSANQPVKEWVEARPRIAELYGKNEPDAENELKAIFRGLVEEMAQWYEERFWHDALDEIAAILS